jgi:hypothetical protein
VLGVQDSRVEEFVQRWIELRVFKLMVQDEDEEAVE